MADNTLLNPGTGGDNISTDDLGTVKVQRVKVQFGADGSASDVATGNPLPVTVTSEPTAAADGGTLPATQTIVGGFDGTNTQAIITDANGRLVVVDGGGSVSVDDNGGSLTVDGTVGISGTVPVSGPLTDTQLRATAVPVSGTVAVSGTVPVSGPLTDTQLRATAVPVSGTVTASGPLTDTQLRASAVPVSVSGTVTTSGPLTDTQLRASAVPVTNSSLPLPTGAATSAKQPALGTAGASSTDVLSIQGVASGTAVPVSVSGTAAVAVTAGNISLLGGTTAIEANATSTGGWSFTRYLNQTTIVQTVKATSGRLGGYMIYNPNTSVAYVQIFNVASATTVTLGTTTPDIVLPIPASSGANLFSDIGLNMNFGIKLACTTTSAGSTAPTTGLDMTVFYR